MVLVNSRKRRASAGCPRPRRANGLPSAEPRPLGGFSAAERERALGNQLRLPRAVRVPPEASSAEYVLARLENVNAVREFLDAPANKARLQAEKTNFIAGMRQRAPEHGRSAIEDRIRGTLIGTRDHRYSVENVIGRMHKVRWAQTKPGKPTGRDMLRASEYLNQERPAAFWQLRTLILLIMIIEDLGWSERVLSPRDVHEAKCAICLESLHEKGAMSAWRQLEPCRHWLCESCHEEQTEAHHLGTCALCRAEIAEAVLAVAV